MSGWICADCRPWRQLRRSSAIAQVDERVKPYYVTTPIFYVNAAPHVGHMYTMILADVVKRWQIINGKEAVLCTGTDEHGLKIQQAARKAEQDPQAFCDIGAETFKDLAKRINISYDHFVRTSDKSHKEAVEYAWMMLEHNGYIYRSKHEGWYAISDEAFYPDAQVHVVLDPRTGRKMMVSKETGNEVQWSSEENYHFRLSAFRDRLLKFYAENPRWITPPHRMKEVASAVEHGLGDLSISRPYERLKWAIRVPSDSSQSIYVWLDALLNYASKAGYPWPPGDKTNFWPADVHVIGKDIVRFHCIYWPAFLMALDLPLPKRIMTHGHWLMDDRKMSKSLGNVVNPFWAIDRFNDEILRFFLVHHGGIEADANYDNLIIVGRYKNDLQFRLGNLASRVLRGRMYDAEQAVGRYGGNADELIADCRRCAIAAPADVQGEDRRNMNWKSDAYLEMLQQMPGLASGHFEDMAPNRALHAIMTTVFAANAFMQNNEPWKISKQIQALPKSEGDKHEVLSRRLSCNMFLLTETLRIVGILLQPYMPNKASELLDWLQVDAARRRFVDTAVCADSSYGRVDKEKAVILFPPLINEF